MDPLSGIDIDQTRLYFATFRESHATNPLPDLKYESQSLTVVSVPADDELFYKEYTRRFQNLVTDAAHTVNYGENTCVIGNGLIHETPTLVVRATIDVHLENT